MIVRDATYADILTVALAMRDADRREVFAARPNDSVEQFAHDFATAGPRFLALKSLWAYGADGPVALIGAVLRWPGVASVSMIATEAWPEIAFAATRWVLRSGLPLYVDPHAHRCQCEAWEDNHISRRWLESLGFRAEGLLEAYGKNRERFVQYARVLPG